MKSKLYTFLTYLILFLAILQSPLLYYYTTGFLGIFLGLFYILFGFGCTITFLILSMYFKNINRIQINILIISMFIGISTLFFLDKTMENIDWELRKSSRDEIVALVKGGKIVPNVSHNNIIATLDNWSFPPISNGGNEIAIYKSNDTIVTVEFFIDRGFLDHYSAFVYTNDSEQIKIFNNNTKSYKKLSENWYKVSY